MTFNGNYSTKYSNIALLCKKKQMLTGLSKFSSEFPQLEGFGLITRINFHSHKFSLAYACIALASVKLHLSSTVTYTGYIYHLL